MRTALSFAAPLVFATQVASAEPIDLSYEAVMHVADSTSFQVLDKPNHAVGIARFRGLALLDDSDEIVIHRYEGWFDLVEGEGPFHGYAIWVFSDADEIRAAYDGQATSDDAGGLEVSASFKDFSGTGRFDGVTGEGSFSGRRIAPIDEGGSTYLRGSLDLQTTE